MFEILENREVFAQRQVYSVSRLNAEARGLLEGNFPLLWIEGELSNFSRPASGHWYFSLKDAQAQVRCAMFRLRNMHLGFAPRDGMQVLLRARVSLYEGRGEFQLIAEHMEEAGDGALRRAFDLLKQRLLAAGLFDAAHKKPLPRLPQRIGVITSPTGAALRDILCCLQRRFPTIPVLIYPTPVQGTGAADKIAQAICLAARRAECDVLIVSRGGGSLEDLFSFNAENVARAIFDCAIPIVTGIGHEVDFTIADFVADHRAATPTAAAEAVSPDRQDWLQKLARLEQRLVFGMQTLQLRKAHTLRALERHIQHPGQRLRNQAQRLDELEQRLTHAQQTCYRHARAQLAELQARLLARTPLHELRALTVKQATLATRLQSSFAHRLARAQAQLELLARALHDVSPLATLARGYAIVRLLPTRTVLRSACDLTIGNKVEAQLKQGILTCRIEVIDYD